MNFYIQVWPNQTATLMLENGTAVWTYPSVEAAEMDFNEWHQHQSKESAIPSFMQDPACSTML